jgi:hypothetical protein
MRCAWCRHPLDEVHGHGACLRNGCPMFGLNQAECCSGETAEDGWVPTSDLASAQGDTDEPVPEKAQEPPLSDRRDFGACPAKPRP